MYIALTVFFEDPFWVGLVERGEGAGLRAGRIVFGAEPSDAQVYDWVLAGMPGIRLSGEVRAASAPKLAVNPKRRQRQARAVSESRVGTKAQQALASLREACIAERKAGQRAMREQRAAERFALRQAQKREKHKGH